MPAVFIPNPLAAKLVELEAAPYIKDVAEQGAEIGKRLAPVETGALRDSIHVEDNPDGEGQRVVVTVDYWPFVEFGTSIMAAQPYLRPIIDELGLHR